MSQIKFKKGTYAMGRNGISQCKGLDTYPTTRLDKNNQSFPVLIITPINSKGDLTNCWTEIDMTVMPALIKDLQHYYDEYTKTKRVQRSSSTESV